MYKRLMLSGRLKYIQLNHQYTSPMPLRLKWLLKSCKDIHHQYIITIQQN